jgi:glycosyltransferase involved in cell wall biosynthesis
MIKQNKIAILCNYELLPERVGGMDYFFWLFDTECKKKNISVDWFFPNQSNHGEYSKLTILHSDNHNIENYFLDCLKVNKKEYSYIITHFIELCTPFFYKISKLTFAKIIAIDHNPRPLNGYVLKKKIEKKVKGILFSRYIDLFIGVSNYTVNQIIKDFGSHLKMKTNTIYNGVFIGDIHIRTKRKYFKPTFLVVSHLRESKGVQDLIAAVHLLPPTIKNELKIDIYGDGPYKNELVENIKHLHLENCFCFMGNKPNLKELYSNYDYMLQPTHMECFSLSILESLAANVPVITTNVGGNEEVIDNGVNGFIFDVKNTLELKGILENIYLGNLNINTNTRILIENYFSLMKMVNEHIQLIK